LIAFLQLWLKFRDGIDKYWIVPVRKLFYFRHWYCPIHNISPCSYGFILKSIPWLQPVTCRQGRQGRQCLPTIIMKCAKRIRDPR